MNKKQRMSELKAFSYMLGDLYVEFQDQTDTVCEHSGFVSFTAID